MVTLSELKKRNFGLTEEQFKFYVNCAINGNPIILQILFESHFDICVSYLIKYIKLNKDEASDATMNAIIEFWDKLLKSKIKYGNLSFLLTKMAFQVHVKTKLREQRLDPKTVISFAETIQNDYCEECLKQALLKLNENERNLISTYYVDDVSMADLSKLDNIKEFTLRKRKQRAVEFLKQEFFKIYDP